MHALLDHPALGAAKRRLSPGIEAVRASGSFGRLPPGPIEPPVLQLAQFLLQPLEYVPRCRREFGSPFTLRLPYVPPIVQFHEPDAVKEVFSGSPEELHAGEANLVLEPLLGPNSLLLLDGARHRSQRRLLTPPFRGDRMKAYGIVMRDITYAALDALPVGEPIRFHDVAQQITLDVIVRTVFGLDERDGEQLEALRADLAATLSWGARPELMVRALQVDLGPSSPWGRFQRLMQRTRARIRTVIALRRRDAASDRNDVLTMLLGARHEDGAPMTDEEIVDEMLTLLLAGHETTATGIAWAVHRMILHEDVQERARAEVLSLFGDDVDPERIAEATYVHGLTQETLRMHPVVPGVGRVLKMPGTFAGHRLPSGVIVGLSVVLAHFDPRSFPEPRRFRPERFLERRPTPYEFFPFGGGVRRCIGMAFALYEMDIVLAAALSRFRFRKGSDAPIHAVRRSVTLAPSDGMPVVLERVTRA